MTLRTLNVDWKFIKSYKTEQNLLKRLEEIRDLYPDYNDRVFTVRTPEGRWTAIVILDKSTGGYVGRYEDFLKV